MLLVDAPAAANSPQAMADAVLGGGLPQSSHAALYFPRVQIDDPLNPGALRLAPPSGSIAGMIARTDEKRGVWRAPAGTEAQLLGVQQLAQPMSDDDSALLNPLGVNGLRLFPAQGVLCWGARTLRGADALADDFKYLPVRRLALFIEDSLQRGTGWVVFEPNGEALWAALRQQVEVFMDGLFRQGAFLGQSAREAFWVRCGEDTTTEREREQGQLRLQLAFAAAATGGVCAAGAAAAGGPARNGLSVAGLPVHQVGRRLSLAHRLQGGQALRGGQFVAGLAGDVRGAHQLRVLPGPVFGWQRLLAVHVQRGAGQRATVQQRAQVGFHQVFTAAMLIR